MASNKERIEALETELGGVQDGLQQMELGMADKFNHLEATIQNCQRLFSQVMPHLVIITASEKFHRDSTKRKLRATIPSHLPRQLGWISQILWWRPDIMVLKS